VVKIPEATTMIPVSNVGWVRPRAIPPP
jgi:hypothetical protein